MKSKTPGISERLIEKARLGELEDDTYRDLIARLKARNELHRLDDAIERDQQFLERHPPHLIAAQIRHKLSEDVHSNHAPFFSGSKIPVAFALASLGGLAAVLFFSFEPPEPSPRADAHAINASAEKLGGAKAPSETTSPKAEPVQRRDLDVEQEVLCVVGERFEFNSDPVERLSVTPDDVVTTRTSNGGQTLSIGCKSPGKATIEIPRTMMVDSREARFTERIRIDVARPLTEEEQASIDQRVTQLDECISRKQPPEWFRTAKLTLSWKPTGEIDAIDTSGSSISDSVLNCLQKIVTGWQLVALERDGVLRQTSLEWENMPGPEGFSEGTESDSESAGEPDAVARAQKALLSGQAHEAIRLCEGYLKRDPDKHRTKCHRIIGVGYRSLEQMDKACQHFKAAGVATSECDGSIETSGSKESKNIWGNE